MITIQGWEKFQHYKKDKPTWVKLYRDLLGDYAFGKLPDADKWLLVGLWLLAAETGNEIPLDPHWIGQRLTTDEPVTLARLKTLQAAGFIALGEPSRGSLEEVYTKTEEEEEVREREREEKTQPLTTTSPVAEGRAAEGTAIADKGGGQAIPRITDAQLRQEALTGLGLGKYRKTMEIMKVNSELQQLLQTNDRTNLMAALRGAAILRDRGEGGFRKGQSYSPGVLENWGPVWHGEGEKRTQRALYDVAQEVYYASLDDSKKHGSRDGLTEIGAVMNGLLERGAA